jgi:threonine aldolase
MGADQMPRYQKAHNSHGDPMRYLHTMVRVSDLDASLDFYCKKLGLVEVRRMENEKGRFTLVFLATPDDAARIAAAGDSELAAQSPVIELTHNWDEKGYSGGRNFGHLAYRVGDIYALCEKLMAAGVTINRPPRDGHMAFIRSPDGISIELLQEGTLPPREPWVSNFASDNAYGALPEVMDALVRANQGAARPYGDDSITQGLPAAFSALFAREVAVFACVTGTAANALALATLTPPHGAILCHAESHINEHECGAPEFYAHSAKLIGLHGESGKLTLETITNALDAIPRGFVHTNQPYCVSLSQPTELGTLYSLAELGAIADACHARGVKLHLDGARFANALAALGATPAQATWQCGVDALSFGASKGGTLGAEAVVFFNPADAADFAYRRKKGGHLVSKMRFVSAQLEAYVENGLWLQAAARANALATRLADGLQAINSVTITVPVQTNMVFAEMPLETAQRLRDAGAVFYDWRPPANGRVLNRLATSFATPEEDVAKFLEIAKG